MSIFDILVSYGIIGAIPLSLAACAVYAAARAAFLRFTGRKPVAVSAEIARGLLVWYFVTLAVVVWFPYLPELAFGRISAARFAELTFRRGEIAWNARFAAILRGRLSVLRDFELLANIILFVPYGALLPLAFGKLRRWRAVCLAAFGTTLIVELAQPFVGRSFDTDDIIANTLGAVIGRALVGRTFR